MRGGFSFYGNDGREEKTQTTKIHHDKRVGRINELGRNEKIGKTIRND